MNIVFDFMFSVAANVIGAVAAYYICKWLDGKK